MSRFDEDFAFSPDSSVLVWHTGGFSHTRKNATSWTPTQRIYRQGTQRWNVKSPSLPGSNQFIGEAEEARHRDRVTTGYMDP